MAKSRQFPGFACMLCCCSMAMLASGPVCASNVIMHTSLGDVEIELFDELAPATVANFLNYVNDGDYADSIIHRSVPGFIVQGGGFTFIDGVAASIPADPPVINEPGTSNLRGTIAMAKLGGDPNSATSGWFFNLADNSANLDSQNGGFTVFGRVIDNGMVIVDAIAALQVWNAGSPFTDLPLINYPGSGPITADHLVLVNVAIHNGFDINAGLNDAWVNAGAPRQGLLITVFPVLKIIFLAWFTFDSKAPAEDVMAVFGAADQRWVSAAGAYDGSQAVLNAELTSGGLFNSSQPVPQQDNSYGTITLDFSSCDEASVSFDFPSAGESGAFNIQRAVPGNSALCEALSKADDIN